MFEEMTPEESAMLEWQYHFMGDFRIALMVAIGRADDYNLVRLERGFPVEVNGYRKFANESGWWERVVEKAIELGYLKGHKV